MDIINAIVKSARPSAKSDATLLYTSYVVFGLSLVYAVYSKVTPVIALILGTSLILFALTEGDLGVSLIAGALVGLVAIYAYPVKEAFQLRDETDPGIVQKIKDILKPTPQGNPLLGDDAILHGSIAAPSRIMEGLAKNKKVYESFENPEAEEEAADEEAEAEEEPPAPAPKAKAKPKKKRAPAPDHADRAEAFQLGKKYTMPKEDDDDEFHLDAGTTFLNAYKSLKPDQVAAMTKDTQELMATQKQLMSTLQTLRPLIKDGKDMMEMFQSYFGNGQPSAS